MCHSCPAYVRHFGCTVVTARRGVSMRLILTLSCAMCLTAAAASAKSSTDDVKRLNQAKVVLDELRGTPEGIPQDLWSKAQCAVVIPSLKKAAFIVGGEYGSGVMSCRTNDWSTPVFMQIGRAHV